jgi:hypothetical protein
MNTIDKKYQDLLQDILDTGIVKSDRTGTDKFNKKEKILSI